MKKLPRYFLIHIIQKIFEGITSVDIEHALNNISKIVSSSEEVKNNLSIFLEKVYDNKLSNMEFKEILDEIS